MSTEHRTLLMNANRRLGAALVEHNLVKIEDLEQANERLLEIVATNQPRQSTVLGILAYEMKVVREDDNWFLAVSGGQIEYPVFS
jgi:hypothetical protein